MDIVFDRALKEADRNVVLNGLLAFNRDRTASNAGPEADIGLLIRHPETGETEGGLTARMYYGWMFVELLFVPERRRGQGLGKRLMAEAERVARQEKLVGIWLDTFEFQARGFYEKLGFEVFGSLDNYPSGSSRYFLRKQFSLQ